MTFVAKKVRPVRCPLCKRMYVNKLAVYSHIENSHADQLPDGMSGGEYYYRLKYGHGGKCVICHKDTLWNYKTNKFKRFCENPACKQKYKELFRKRMIGKYGKTHLTDDPEQQRKMLAARKISGLYQWSDGSGKIPYTGTYELDFLKYIDLILDFEFTDVNAPSPHTYTYTFQGAEHFYIPDFYIESLNLEVEIKASDNTHHKIVAVDHVKEKLKDDVMRSQNVFNYIKIYDKDYTEFTKLVQELKEKDDVTKDIIIIAEDPVINDPAIRKMLAMESAVEPFNFDDESTLYTKAKEFEDNGTKGEERAVWYTLSDDDRKFMDDEPSNFVYRYIHKDAGIPVGFIHLNKGADKNGLYVSLAVKPDNRGQRIAGMMLDKALNFADETDYKKIYYILNKTNSNSLRVVKRNPRFRLYEETDDAYKYVTQNKWLRGMEDESTTSNSTRVNNDTGGSSNNN